MAIVKHLARRFEDSHHSFLCSNRSRDDIQEEGVDHKHSTLTSIFIYGLEGIMQCFSWLSLSATRHQTQIVAI